MIQRRHVVAAVAVLVVLLVAPAGAAGEVRHVQVPSWDGTRLDGWLHFPAASVERAPVVLVSSPYFGQTHPTSGPYPTGDRVEGNEWQAPIRRLTSEGYVVAMFSVRGTGNSGGCFDFFGPSEERDQPYLVEWLARQPWSNGNVGMIGLSYLAGTAIEAAVRRPPALKTIAVTGVVTDWWVFNGSPQGAVGPGASGFAAAFPPGISLQPPIGEPRHSTLDHLPVVPERMCPEVARMYEAYGRDLGALPRAAGFYRARQRLDRLRRVRASVLIAHGFNDTGHDFQEDEMWRALPEDLPKRQVEGPWGHEWPQPLGETPPSAWENELVRWLDHWLKGGPPPAGLGRVDYEDGAGRSHSSSSWPPADARLEGLYLSRAGLTAQPGTEASTVRSIPTTIGDSSQLPVCPDGLRQLYLTPPLKQEVIVAGNPYLRFTVTSDRQAGMLGAYLYDVGPDFNCVGPAHRGAVRPLTVGTADLRYHTGSYEPVPFPVGTPTTLRIDLSNLAERIPEGHRIALTLTHPRDRYGGPEPAGLTVAAGTGEQSSQLVLPLVEGSLGADAPATAPPPRPFGADWYRRR